MKSFTRQAEEIFPKDKFYGSIWYNKREIISEKFLIVYQEGRRDGIEESAKVAEGDLGFNKVCDRLERITLHEPEYIAHLIRQLKGEEE